MVTVTRNGGRGSNSGVLLGAEWIPVVTATAAISRLEIRWQNWATKRCVHKVAPKMSDSERFRVSKWRGKWKFGVYMCEAHTQIWPWRKVHWGSIYIRCEALRCEMTCWVVFRYHINWPIENKQSGRLGVRVKVISFLVFSQEQPRNGIRIRITFLHTSIHFQPIIHLHNHLRDLTRYIPP